MKAPLSLLLVGTVLLAGCGPLRPYKYDIHQGNILSEKAVKRVEIGMTRDQVRYHLGTPMIDNLFSQNAWDYVYTVETRGVPGPVRRLHLVFKDDKLALTKETRLVRDD